MSKIDKMRKAQGEKAPTVQHRCGHERALASVACEFCPPCRKKAALRRRRKMLSDGARRAERNIAPKMRLPNGSKFEAAWDAEAAKWTGTLKVPGLPPFKAEMSGLFSLLNSLDTMFRYGEESMS